MERTNFKKIEDAPAPTADGQEIYIKINDFEYREYVSGDGKWLLKRIVYPATMD